MTDIDTNSTAIQNRYEFAFLFDVRNGNPNGDPDAGNMPRMDPETGKGLVTDVALKRKIRNYVAAAKAGEDGHAIYVADKAVLNNQHRKAYDALGLPPVGPKAAVPGDVTRWLCANFFDIRTFGAVMTTDVNGGQVRGPVQLTFAESVEPVVPMEVSITRMAVTNEKDAEKERTMGNKHIVPYGLYRVHGFVSASDAAHPTKGTGFSEADLELLWSALQNMFDIDRSASRGEMSACALVVFRHESRLGNAPAAKLLRRVSIKRAEGSVGPARSFEDYVVAVDEAELPAGVTVIRKF